MHTAYNAGIFSFFTPPALFSLGILGALQVYFWDIQVDLVKYN